MSMIGNLSRIPEDVLVELHKNPKIITGILYEEYDDEPIEQPGFFSRLLRKKPPSLETQTTNYSLSDDDTTDVDKAWHALHFLLTGSEGDADFPQGFLASCGEEVGDIDVGYGPVRSFSSEQVKGISQFLNSLDKSELRCRFDPAKFKQKNIYPDIWADGKNSKEDWEYLEEYLDQLIRFVNETAEKKMAMLVYIN